MKSKLITNRKKAKQLLAFDDMFYGRCSPTDIDFSIDFQQKVFIFGEVKTKGRPLTLGQRIHLEGLCNAIALGGLDAYAVLCSHDTSDCEEDVHVSEAYIEKVYYQGQWITSKSKINVGEWISLVYNEHMNQTKGN